MNNWRLLLLALVAVFQPSTSFTERNLVNGRQQCCDRQTDTLLRDSRPYLYEINQLAKPSSPIRRLNFRDETREDRQLRQQVTSFSRRSTERSLQDIRERHLRQSPSIISRSNRVNYRRIASDDNSEHGPDILRERNALTRISMMQRNVKTNELSSRYSQSRDETQTNRLSNEHQDRVISQHDRTEFRSGSFHRLTPTRATRGSLWMKREAENRVRVSYDSRRLLERERVNVILRESMSRDDVRRNLDRTHERREQDHRAEQRRSLSENSRIVERVRNMQVRVNSRDQRQENWARLAVSLQQNNDRRQSRETVKENSDLRVSGERMLSDRRNIRDSRLMNDRHVRDRAIENRRDTRQTERISKETRDDQFVRERREESRAQIRMAERDNRVTDQRARSSDLQSFRDTRSDSKLSRSAETVRASDATRRQTAFRNKMANRERDTVDDRYRNVESVIARDNSIMIKELQTESESIGNWQYIFYSVQAAYLCGLVMQMLTPKRYEKSKMGNLRWWPLASLRLIKVD